VIILFRQEKVKANMELELDHFVVLAMGCDLKKGIGNGQL
jgi:hypothetical protein